MKFLALDDGNLFGLVIGSASWKNNDAYYFPSINIKKGEEIIIHFNVKGEGCISEMGDDLNLAEELTAKDGIRDLWLDNTKSVFGNTNDVVYVRNLQTGKIIDGFTYTDKEKEKWPENLNSWAVKLAQTGVFNSPSIDDAVFISPISSTNPLVRVDTENIIKQLNFGEEIILPIKTDKNSWKAKKEL